MRREDETYQEKGSARLVLLLIKYKG